MDSRTSTAEAKHSYRAEAWSPKQADASHRTQPQAPTSPQQEPQPVHQQQASPTVPFPANLEFLPLWLPQQSNIFQAQLLHYNTLISPTRGGGLQTAPLPPVVSSPNVQASPRSRTSSKATAQGGNGSRSRRNSEKARSAVTNKDTAAKMTPKQNPEPAKNSTQRPPAISSSPKNQSYASSVPNTPHQHARKFSFESRDPSPNDGGSHSPRSVYSETNSALPSLRPLPPRLGGCKFETSQINSRRRIPYSVGSDRLEKLDLRTVKNKLSGKDEDTLTKDMREIYNRLLPTDQIEKNRKALVDKLEKIFNDEWPGHDIKVYLFGSSGNLLCSDDSDVDICITTPWKELEGVCIIADLLAKRGMEKVVCISAAKVPIVKIWDPELGLACDMNVNNTIALENTRMVRTYVEADPRVRQLAMIIKYWTKRRIINDAAFGGTLSSYTWICLIVAFLQLRSPAVLPALHQLPYKTLKSDGTVSDFADNLKKIEGFGSKNKSSEADLLFQFFRFYAHEFDYDKHVLSVRSGKLMSKVEKKWNYALNNQLCVEEPFNTARNLGNTADEYSFRGLHLELRRAFDLISQAKLEEACEQFVFPKEEERVWSRPAPQPRPVLVRSSSQTHSGRGGRHNHRGGRHNNFRGGGNGSNRRASSVVPNYDANVFMHPVNMPQDMMWYQSPQFQFQYAQQDLMTQMAYHQESMRQYYAQSPAFVMHQNMGQQRLSTSSSSGQQSTDRSRTNSFDNAPTAAPLRPDLYAVYSMSLGHGFYPPSNTGYGTYPSSPVTAAGQDFRRPLQRSATASDAGMQGGSSSMRSQSQPASRTGSSVTGHTHPGQQQGAPFLANRSANGVPIPSFISDEADFDETPKATSESSVSEDNKSQSFFHPRSSSPVKQAKPTNASDIAFGDIASQNATFVDETGRKPPTLAAVVRQSSRSPSPRRRDTTQSTGIVSAPLPSVPFNGVQPPQSTRPLVVNGSGMKPVASAESSYVAAAVRPVPDDAQLAYMANALHIHNPAMGQEPPLKDTGASTELTVAAKTSPVTPRAVASEEASFRDRIARMGGPYYATVAANRTETVNKETKTPLSAQQKLLNRQKQGGIIAPLDLALGENASAKQQSIDMAHLSPVYETRTPSPAAHRKTAESTRGATKENGRDASRPLLERPDLPKTDRERDGLYSESPRGIGHVRAARSEGDGGWQKAGKSKKKNQSALSQAIHAEQPPRNDVERKGG